MDPIEISARFAAFVWYADALTPFADAPGTQQDAAAFADDHWQSFLPWSHEGLGKLLIDIGNPGISERRFAPDLMKESSVKRRRLLTAGCTNTSL